MRSHQNTGDIGGTGSSGTGSIKPGELDCIILGHQKTGGIYMGMDRVLVRRPFKYVKGSMGGDKSLELHQNHAGTS